MKRILLDSIPGKIPDEVRAVIRDSEIYDSSCSPQARVYFANAEGGCYVKRADKGTLEREALMNKYFHSKSLGPDVLFYGTDDSYDWLITKRICGEDLTDAMYLAEPKRLSAVLGERLRLLHETDYTGCPVLNRRDEYVASVEKNYRSGNYDKSAFPDSFGYKSADEAYAVVREGASLLLQDVLIHGDYCLPNIMLDSWRFSGFIDLGNGGVADRHIDIFWGAFTLWFNLKTDSYKDRFFDAYGRDKIDKDILKIVAACEVFG